MRLTLRRRALISLGLALSFVVSAATPAHALASVYSGFRNRYVLGYEEVWGTTETSYDPAIGTHPAYVQATNLVKDRQYNTAEEGRCVEMWVDQKFLISHRAPDVFINCKTYPSPNFVSPQLPMHWSTSSGPGSVPLPWSQSWTGGTPHPGMIVCNVEVRGPNRMKREWGYGVNNCTGDEVNSLSQSAGIYDGKPYLWTTNALTEMNDLNEPEHIRADGIASLYENESLHPGGLLLSTDGHYSAVMQYNGDFVLFNNWTNTVTWAASWCGLSPQAGSRLQMHSDGNLVVWSPTGVMKWASLNMSTCHGGGFLYGGNHLELDTSGNLTTYAWNGWGAWSWRLWI